ncbi:uncharacterized protein [Rutidosis leptorrhynchoides]|uniref:uncharacterized protein n=1 Tax=Rutidosis leptorrhynchoides TaxID=125765 RepID=UPI003A9A139A
MTEHLIADEKLDGLDIVSIGKLYEGPLEKKYWSSSRGRDRHPYPVGYAALRNNNGNIYKMSILEGLKGPDFTISSTDGHSYSGQTPDIAWEGFQKKSSARIKIMRGKRFSGKINGAEFFGFKNPLVMKLLKGLKTNGSQITEQNLPLSSFGNEKSKATDENHNDLEVSLVKTEGKGKKSKKRKENNVKPVSVDEHKRGRSQEPVVSADGAFHSQIENHTEGTKSLKNKETINEACNEDYKSHLLSAKDEYFEKEKLYPVEETSNFKGSQDLLYTKGTKSLKNEENVDDSILNPTPGTNSLKTEDGKGDQPFQKESQMLDTLDLYAPDTLDPTLDSTCNLEVEISKETNCTGIEKLDSSQVIVSEKCVTESQSKEEIANSMMTLLLPKALPLLKTFSRKKKTSKNCRKDEQPVNSSEKNQLEKHTDKVQIQDKCLIENLNFEKQNEDLNTTSTNVNSAVAGSDDSIIIAPDTFENDPCEVTEYFQAIQIQDAINENQDINGTHLCTDEVHHVCPNNQPNEEAYGVGIALNDEVENIFELLSCYEHPTPILMVMLRTYGNEVFVCVICGNSIETDRTLLFYKAFFKGESKGCPSFIGHTTIVSPMSEDTSRRQILLDSSSLQLTPDGKCLVLLNNIKAPYCSEGSVNCTCSTCTSDCFEGNAIKVVQVKLGYVQVVCKLSTTNDVRSILVCEPNYIVAAEDTGKINLWTMNSQWSEPTDQSCLPPSDSTPNCIVQMKRLPNFPALVVGQTAFGDFFLWNLTRRIIVSKFSSPITSSLPFVPVNVFRCPSQESFTSEASRKKKVADIMEETQRWSLEADKHGSVPVNEEDLSLVLFASVSNHDHHDEYMYKDSGVTSGGCWSLALLAKSKMVSENTLDPSATVAGAAAGYGIIGTCNGSLYIWDLSTGTKLGYLSCSKGGKVSCLAVDDSDFGAFAVVVNDSQLQNLSLIVHGLDSYDVLAIV